MHIKIKIKEKEQYKCVKTAHKNFKDMKPKTNIPEREKYLFVQFEPFFSSIFYSFIFLSHIVAEHVFDTILGYIFSHLTLEVFFVSSKKKVFSISYGTVWMFILEYYVFLWIENNLPKHKVLGNWSITEQWTDRRSSWTVNHIYYAGDSIWFCFTITTAHLVPK